MQNPFLIGYAWCAIASIASAGASYLIKMSAHVGDTLSLARLIWLGAACGSYGLGFICYSVALQKLHVSLAYPVMTGITMVLVTLIAYFVLKEPLGIERVAGIALVASGVFLLAR